MPDINLSDDEKKVLDDARELEILERSRGWKLLLSFLTARAEAAEQRMWANLSDEPRISHHLQVVARERRAVVASALDYLAEVKRNRRGILSDIMGVPIEKVDEALTEETITQ